MLKGYGVNFLILMLELENVYKNYIFDLYGTLVDIHTDEEQKEVWEKCVFFMAITVLCIQQRS